jgi:2-phosphosulfolactate phosphatase
MPKRVDLALLPAEAAPMAGDCYVVVDVLRATTTIAVLFARGLRELLVADSLERARELARRDALLLFGEVGGLPPAGFDHGNSPVEASTLDLVGAGAVLFTTNGTRALCGLPPPPATICTGAPANLGAVVEHLLRQQHIVVVCAGEDRGRRFALEDFAAAGRIIRETARRAPGAELGDAARLALEAIGPAGGPDRAAALIAGSEHARALSAGGLGADVAFAVRDDTSAATPVVANRGEGWALLTDRR